MDCLITPTIVPQFYMFSEFIVLFKGPKQDTNGPWQANKRNIMQRDILTFDYRTALLRLPGGDQPELEIKFETNMSQIIMQVADPTNPDVLAAHNRKPHGFQ